MQHNMPEYYENSILRKDELIDKSRQNKKT